MKRTRFKRTRIEIGDEVEFSGGFYCDTGVVRDIKGSSNNRLIFVAWDHQADMNPMAGDYGAVQESDLQRIAQK